MTAEALEAHQGRNRPPGSAYSTAELRLELDDEFRIKRADGALDAESEPVGDKLAKWSILDLIHEDDRPVAKAALEGVRHGGQIDQIRFRLAGSDKMVMLRANRSPAGASGFRVALTPPLPRTRSHEDDARPAPERDAQSGALSRDSFVALVQDFMIRTQASNQDEQLSLLHLFGLDDLVARSGEGAVSELLKKTSEYLRFQSMGGDAVGRLDFDKYGIVHDRAVEGEALASRVGELSRAADPDGKGVSVKRHSIDLDQGDLSDVDVAKVVTYTIKIFVDSPAAASNVSSLSDGFHYLMSSTLRRLSSLKKTVAGKEFYLVFQPIVDLLSDDIRHFEVLCRFEDGKAPDQVFPFAEDIGLIEELDLAVAQNVIDLLSRHRDSDPNLQLAVNVSGKSIESTIFNRAFEKLAGSIKDHRENLILEITETSQIGDLEKVNHVIQALRKKGHLVCLDDFGSGAASLGYLQSLTVDCVKIDGAYVEKMGKSEQDGALIRGMVTLCQELGVKTIAERIETPAQAERLRAMKVDLGQGWLFGKPQKQTPTSSRLASIKRRAAG